MLQRILVPLDGSPQAEQAIPVAAQLARASGGTVVLVRALHLPGAAALPSMAHTSWAFVADTWTDIARTYLAHAASLPALADVATETAVCSGSDARSLLGVARAQRADAIVLSSQGHPSARDWGLDEVVRQVIRDAEIPVLAIPEHGPVLDLARDGWLRPLRALVALDGSVHAEAVLYEAMHVVASLAAPGIGALHLLHVVSNGADDNAMEDARAYLSAVTHDLRTGPFADRFLDPTWSVVRDHDVVRAVLAHASRPAVSHPQPMEPIEAMETPADIADILEGHWDGGELDGAEFQRAYGADLIVMATYGLRGPEGWEAEGIVENVLRLAARPVLLVRPPVGDLPSLPPDVPASNHSDVRGDMVSLGDRPAL